jgi:4-amino-4-deoxy-L-arabinose transferase-like glycosyltransferase
MYSLQQGLRDRTSFMTDRSILTVSPSTRATSALQTNGRSIEAISVFGLVLLAVVILWWRWVGYQGHDDAYYATAALDWVQNFPAVGADHWAMRYPLVVPTAGIIALLGPSVWALAAVNVVAYAIFLVVMYFAVRHWFSWLAAVIVTLISIVLPQFPVQATYANPDLLEMALVVASFWTLMLARERGGPPGLLLSCGVLAGIGFLTRETTLSLVLLFGLLFVFRPAMPRWRYLLVGLAFAVMVGGQMGYLAVRTGDPLRRIHLSATHDQVDRSAKHDAAASEGRALDSEGVLATSPVVAPLAAIFISQKYGLLFFLAIPAYAVLRVGRWMTASQRSVVDCAALGALIAFLFVAVNTTILYIVPRYFMASAALAAVPVGVLGSSWIEAGGRMRTTAVLLGIVFVGTSFGLLYLENTQPLRAEERLVQVLAATDGIVHVNPETVGRMQYLLLAQGLRERVTSSPPAPGDLVMAVDGVVQACVRSSGCAARERMLPFLPGLGWTELARYKPPRRTIAGLVRALGLERFISLDILQKIEQPGVDAIIYRVQP